ncbi:TPA: hypothetical protein R4F10_004424 [Salmonella enterica subsp. enterica serovar Poona]|nr:hypothetical protein [Salmonella enterica subsp. enterica serovar Poona]
MEQDGVVIFSQKFNESINVSDVNTKVHMVPHTSFQLESDLSPIKRLWGTGIADRGRIHLNVHEYGFTYGDQYDISEYRIALDGTIKPERNWQRLPQNYPGTAGIGFVCGFPSLNMESERTEAELSTWMKLTGKGMDSDGVAHTFRVSCTHKWKLVPAAQIITVTPENLYLSGKVGEEIVGNFDIRLVSPPHVSALPPPTVTWHRVSASQCELRVWNKYNNPWPEGFTPDTSYNNVIKMSVAVRSNEGRVCVDKLNLTVNVT